MNSSPNSNILTISKEISNYLKLKYKLKINSNKISEIIQTFVLKSDKSERVLNESQQKTNKSKQKIISYVNGDLLSYNKSTDCLVHQINVVTKTCKGLAESIEKKFPYNKVYGINIEKKFGDVILKSSNNKPYIANIVGQIGPSKPGNYAKQYNILPNTDTYQTRLNAFKSALDKLSNEIKNSYINHILFPHGIGCGLAGGDWTKYEQLIKDFRKIIPSNIQISIVKLV
jgi:hypothetical protein